jgi:hypothetical protein
MIDGIHFGGQVLVVALGIAESGEKHVLGVWQGATENTTVVKGLLEDLVDRGLDLQRRYLVVMDGSKALRGSLTVPNIESRCNQLKLGHPHGQRNLFSNPTNHQSRICSSKPQRLPGLFLLMLTPMDNYRAVNDVLRRW